MKPVQHVAHLASPGGVRVTREHGQWKGFLLYHQPLFPWRVAGQAYFAESVPVHLADESRQAVCVENPVCASAVKNLPLEEVFLDDHHISLVIPAHRGEGGILHHPPELSWEGELKNTLVGHTVVCALWWRVVLGAGIWALGLVTLLLRTLP